MALYDLDTEDRIARALSAMDGFAELVQLAGPTETIQLRKLGGLVTMIHDELAAAYPLGRTRRGTNDDD